GDQDVCQGESADSSGPGQGGGGGQRCGQDHRPDDLSPAVRAEHGARSLDVSTLSERDGGVAYLASNLWGDLRRGRDHQTRHVYLNCATRWPVKNRLMFQKSARRALCACITVRAMPYRAWDTLRPRAPVRRTDARQPEKVTPWLCP